MVDAQIAGRLLQLEMHRHAAPVLRDERRLHLRVGNPAGSLYELGHHGGDSHDSLVLDVGSFYLLWDGAIQKVPRRLRPLLALAGHRGAGSPRSAIPKLIGFRLHVDGGSQLQQLRCRPDLRQLHHRLLRHWWPCGIQLAATAGAILQRGLCRRGGPPFGAGRGHGVGAVHEQVEADGQRRRVFEGEAAQVGVQLVRLRDLAPDQRIHSEAILPLAEPPGHVHEKARLHGARAPAVALLPPGADLRGVDADGVLLAVVPELRDVVRKLSVEAQLVQCMAELAALLGGGRPAVPCDGQLQYDRVLPAHEVIQVEAALEQPSLPTLLEHAHPALSLVGALLSIDWRLGHSASPS
mmetsp:Transcript_83874/g.219079  ORF Transcript_83874/g.219079 Transcript_83874/m.219079 type:complete len:352 (-) Transcript_83874:380-1435(-)